MFRKIDVIIPRRSGSAARITLYKMLEDLSTGKYSVVIRYNFLDTYSPAEFAHSEEYFFCDIMGEDVTQYLSWYLTIEDAIFQYDDAAGEYSPENVG